MIIFDIIFSYAILTAFGYSCVIAYFLAFTRYASAPMMKERSIVAANVFQCIFLVLFAQHAFTGFLPSEELKGGMDSIVWLQAISFPALIGAFFALKRAFKE